ncbi:MAG: NAD(P)-binding domain-containing protein [Gemmatimonadota bacterium]
MIADENATGRRLLVLGGGPIGIEAAVLASRQGFQVMVLERGVIGAHVENWGHVRLFSPWTLNRSAWGEAVLRERGIGLADPDAHPTGHEYLRDYLRPLAEAADIGSRIRSRMTVHGVARGDVHKGRLIGERDTAGPFLAAVSDASGGSSFVEADIVFDATGVYGQPGALGPGGLPAAGEDAVNNLIERRIPDPSARDDYAGRHVLLVGDGHSAATTLEALVRLREADADTRVTWVVSAKGPPYEEIPDDPLPRRLALARFGNRAARGEVDGVRTVRSGIRRLARRNGSAAVTFRDGETLDVDRVVANVGYRPDTALTRELQVHHCYASEGPMNLAATLLAQGADADCLTQPATGVDALRSPEADFWVIGAKSYGRNPNFLLRSGFAQIETILGGYT